MDNPQQNSVSTGEIERLLGVLDDLRKLDGEERILNKTYNAMGVDGNSAEAQAVRDRLSQYGDDYLTDLTIALYYDDAAKRADYLVTVEPNPDRVAHFRYRADGCRWAAKDLRYGFNRPTPREELEPPVSREDAAKLGGKTQLG